MSSSSDDETPDVGWEAETQEECVCLLCAERVAGDDLDQAYAATVKHMTTAHDFAFDDVKRALALDFYGTVRLINLVRRELALHVGGDGGADAVTATLAVVAPMLASRSAAATWLTDETLLKPVLVDDRMLMSLTFDDDDFTDSDDDDDEKKESTAAPVTPATVDDTATAGSSATLATENAVLRQRVAELQANVARMHAAMHNMAFGEPDSDSGSDSGGDSDGGDTKRKSRQRVRKSDTRDSTNSSSRSSSHVSSSAKDPNNTVSKSGPDGKPLDATDTVYFSSYSDRGIHETMLRDRARTEAYRDFMYAHGDVFKGKTVLDIGCGTGILSLFAARAGAARVVGIDRADIIDQARKIVALNGYGDVITLVKGKVEEVKLPDDVVAGGGVDIIVSEWMGYFLLFESMLPSVMYARDKWLRAPSPSDASSSSTDSSSSPSPSSSSLPSASSSSSSSPVSMATRPPCVFPNTATMHVTASDRTGRRQGGAAFWRDVYGFDMSPLIVARDTVCGGCTVETVPPSSLLSAPAVMAALNMMTVTDDELDIRRAPFTLRVTRAGTLRSLVVSFNCGFDSVHGLPAAAITSDSSSSASPAPHTVLYTDAAHTPTHWAQTLLTLAVAVDVAVDDVIAGVITGTRKPNNHREYDISVSYNVVQQQPSTDAATTTCDGEFAYTQDFEITQFEED